MVSSTFMMKLSQKGDLYMFLVRENVKTQNIFLNLKKVTKKVYNISLSTLENIYTTVFLILGKKHQ